MKGKIYEYIEGLGEYELDNLKVEVFSEDGQLTVLSVYLNEETQSLVVDVEKEKS
jgi:hypothetical protein